tara:strand:+ start:574 stop:720 length:147 start_codon:yes stop_codon:yes gene_type:complete
MPNGDSASNSAGEVEILDGNSATGIHPNPETSLIEAYVIPLFPDLEAF